MQEIADDVVLLLLLPLPSTTIIIAVSVSNIINRQRLTKLLHLSPTYCYRHHIRIRCHPHYHRH